MVLNITASTIYSKLGNNSSLVPLAIKDIANSCGLTTASYLAGDKVEGKDRFIDEFGTQAIWLWGIPAYKKIFDLIGFKIAKLDAGVDARILKNKDIFRAAQEFAPTKEIKQSLEQVAKNPKLFKNLTIAKFAASTLLTAGTYLGLTKFRHNYTEKQITKDYFEKQKGKNPTFTKQNQVVPFSSKFSAVHNSKKGDKLSFTGGVQDFIFDPVRNLMLVDASITGERLTHARNPQDFLGYVIKEGSFWSFMYFAGPLISKALEKRVEAKHNKSIDLDARVIESETFKKAFKDNSIVNHLKAFKTADVDDLSIYKYAVKQDTKNLVIDMAKKSDIIEVLKNTDIADTRKYVDLDSLRGVYSKIEKLYNQYKVSGETVDEFFNSVRHYKRASVLKNMGACIAALGVLAPAIMLLTRKSDDYQVKKDIESKLAQTQA